MNSACHHGVLMSQKTSPEASAIHKFPPDSHGVTTIIKESSGPLLWSTCGALESLSLRAIALNLKAGQRVNMYWGQELRSMGKVCGGIRDCIGVSRVSTK